MPPVLEQLAIPVGQPVEGVARVGADPRPRRQVVRAGEHVDAVDLQSVGVLDHPAQLPSIRATVRARSVQPLRGESHPPGLTGRNFGKRVSLRLLFPIPQTQIASNPQLTQNAGY